MNESLSSSENDLAARIAASVVVELSRRIRAGEVTMPEYLSPKQVSTMTGVSLKALETWRSVRRGPPYYKIGKRVRYKAEDVRKWIEADGPIR